MFDPALAAIRQVEALGFDPRDVRHIVMTHMDLDHVGGLADFPWATVHMHAAEWQQCTERRTFKDRKRYRPAMWRHGLRREEYQATGEPWFGLDAVRELRGLPPEMLLVPLFGHTTGHCGVAIDGDQGWLLHAPTTRSSTTTPWPLLEDPGPARLRRACRPRGPPALPPPLRERASST
ncbi:MAG: MBL fold metallo-hydrolase [Lautropia sp.]